MSPTWCVMPILAGPEMTEAAVSDLLAQSVPVKILLINQGVDAAFRTRLEQLAEAHPPIEVWHHQPPLPSLSATWNRALDMVWESGGTEALVVNNDTRLHPSTVEVLSVTRARTEALFVSAVGVTPDHFAIFASTARTDLLESFDRADVSKGGPDFSCFLISKEGHLRYRFDEQFIPAFCEDLDMHRRYLLGGDGDRIFSINLPYLHLGSQTLKSVSAERRQAIERQITSLSRVHYAKKWGGGVNEEKWLAPFNEGPGRLTCLACVGDGAIRPEHTHSDGCAEGKTSTPYLQAHAPAAPVAV